MWIVDVESGTIYSVSQKKIPPLRFSGNYSKQLGIFNRIFTLWIWIWIIIANLQTDISAMAIHIYYTFLSTLDDKFLFNYFQL